MTPPDEGEGVNQKGKIFADVLYGLPLSEHLGQLNVNA